jgi:DNA-binding transcriptional regulator YiaG
VVDKPEVTAWFVDEPIADDDPLAPIKQRAAALWTAGEMLEQATRSGTVAARADRIDPAAALTADEAFSADEVRDMWQASGLSQDDLDAAANVAMELWTVEQLRK